MKAKLILLLFVLSCLLQSIQAQLSIPANANAFYQRAMQNINPKHIVWIKNTAASAENKQADSAGLRLLISNYCQSLNLNNADIEALTILLMMQIAKDNEQDLKDQMEAMKKNNDDKKKIREAMDQLNKSKSMISRAVADSFHRLAVISKNSNSRNNLTSVKTANTIVNANISQLEFKNLQDELKQKSDQLSDTGQLQQLRMQLFTDRRKKAIEEISNLMKKISNTESDIISNLK